MKVEPVPFNVMLCGEPVALSVIVMAAVTEVIELAVKLTDSMHLAPAATLVPHVLLCVKPPGSAPVTPTLMFPRVAFPIFVSVTVCAAEVVPTGVPNVSTFAERLTAGAGIAIPFPFSDSCCGDVEDAPSVTERIAAADPNEVGAKVTVIVQDDPAAIVVVVSQAVEP